MCIQLVLIIFVSYRLVSGSGDIKLTKDGNVLLHEMVGFAIGVIVVLLFFGGSSK